MLAGQTDTNWTHYPGKAVLIIVISATEEKYGLSNREVINGGSASCRLSKKKKKVL